VPDPHDHSSSWWRQAVVYQVYVRSFADADGDGTGDIDGLRDRLDHLVDLGVDAIWLNPWYRSPLRDGGYDVADYRDIDPRFGTLASAEALVRDAQQRGIRVIVDLVPNHTSDQHRWFQEAIAAPPGHPARERYIIRPGRGVDGAEPPTDWRAVFGGPAWHRLPDGEWYLHLFDISQPDLNWDHPEVRAEFIDVLRFWLDRGVDGFRVDVAHGMVKDPTFPDIGERALLLSTPMFDDHPHWDRDEVHDIVREWRAVLDEYGAMMVAEAWVRPSRLARYLRPDEFHQSFNFSLLDAPWDAERFRSIIERSVDAATEVGATSTWVVSNHDVVRHATRYALPSGAEWRDLYTAPPPADLDLSRGVRRARAVALLTLSLPGSAYIYQGEELGLHEVLDLPEDVLDDPTWERSGHTDRGRDGCRVPLPWASTGPSYGFGSGSAWLPQPGWFADCSVEAQRGDPGSVLHLYRSALRVRRELLGGDETLEMLDLGADVVGYRRGRGLVCAVNMGDRSVPRPPGEVVLASGEMAGDELPADTAVWVRMS
jgi:alpha-glucosidase